MILIAFVIAGAMLAAWCCAASRGWMPSIFGWYVAVASARTSVSVTTPCCEVSRGALDSKAGSVHCSGVMAGAMGKGIVIVRTPAPVDASAAVRQKGGFGLLCFTHKYLSANSFKFKTSKSTAFGISPASVSITSESNSAVAVIGQSGRSFISS